MPQQQVFLYASFTTISAVLRMAVTVRFVTGSLDLLSGNNLLSRFRARNDRCVRVKLL